MSDNKLKLHFLGPPQIHYKGQPLSFPSRKALALFIYLVVEEGSHSRDRLAALLWPESAPSRARATLRNGLHQLRAALPDDSYLHIERDSLAFDASADYWLDLDVVEKALVGEGVEMLQEAMQHYRGEFLDGFSPGDAPEFDAWIGQQRAQWQVRLVRLFDRLSRLQLDQGQYRRALETAVAWRGHNPLNEAAYRRQMRIQLASGNRSAALETYEQCRRILKAELDVAPLPETEALAAQARMAAAVEGQAAPTTDFQDASPAQFARGPLVGRAAEFGALVACFHRVGKKTAEAAAIIGEAGIGKTRLATDFLGWAEAQSAAILRGRSFESVRQLPYQPLVEALRPVLEQINAPEDYLSDVWLAELSRLFPELLDRYPDLQDHLSRPTEDATQRTRVYEAITRLIIALAKRQPGGQPLLLFLDDLQWADAATLDVLQYAASRWQESQTPLLLLLTARSENLHPMAISDTLQLSACLQEVERTLGLTTLALDALSQADTVEYLAGLGGEATESLAKWLYEETSGQPFYLVETLRDLREQGKLETEGETGSWRLRFQPSGREREGAVTGVPERIRQRIVARLARLSPPAFDLLAASAVLAQGVTFGRLCQVAALGEGEGLRALDDLLRSGLLWETPAPDDLSATTYMFAHDKIRDVVYTEAGDARRRIFHRRALAALTESEAQPALLALHALAAGEREAAFTHSLAAGNMALSLFAVQDAITHYQQARALSKQMVVDREQLERLYLQLGRAYELGADYPAALAVYDVLQQLAQEREDKPLELAALMARTTIYAVPGQHYDPEHVIVLTEQALPLARELGDHAAESKIQWNLMLLQLFTGDISEAVAAGEASLEIARAHDLTERTAYAWHDLTRAYLFSGQAEKGLAAAREAQLLWRQLDNKAMLADNLISSASTRFFWKGENETLISQLEEALSLSQEIDNLWNQSYANHILGTVYYVMGWWGDSLAANEQSIALGLKAGFTVPLFTNSSVQAMIYGMLGQPERGFPWVEKALAEKSELQDQMASSLAAKAFLHLCLDELETADTLIRQSHEHLELQALSSGVFFTFPIDSRLRLAQKRFDQALATAEQFIDHLRKTQILPFQVEALELKGRALLALGRLEDASAALAEASDLSDRLGARYVLWKIYAAQAKIAEEQGEADTARSLWQAAAGTIQVIASKVEERALRESFLETPAVRAVLAQSEPDA